MMVPTKAKVMRPSQRRGGIIVLDDSDHASEAVIGVTVIAQ